jgi:NhaP-type Na+/H+ or K+/H+ antiporter
MDLRFSCTWCYEVILGIILGSLLGYAARKLFQFCEKRRLIDRQYVPSLLLQKPLDLSRAD